ncbi:hypothetical protein [Jannaschia sp. W003]|uniref:hypothetical protein n=1 Tax=Jannaschia sp. W003 TaxID=2867012 RepID=UPI0021A4F3A0|nr:hypothetical protein [Jannaschia sp. W003]UWQ21566.1 hypothetical protein K3554_00585 [Jannaschia sp. W003]
MRLALGIALAVAAAAVALRLLVPGSFWTGTVLAALVGVAVGAVLLRRRRRR